MTCPQNHRPDQTARHLRLGADLDVLDQWSESASQADRNAVYEALFAVADGSVESTRPTVRHPALPNVATVFCRAELIVTVAVTEPAVFDVIYVGPPVINDQEDRPNP